MSRQIIEKISHQQFEVCNGNVDLSDCLRGENTNVQVDDGVESFLGNFYENERINDNNSDVMIKIMDEVARRVGFSWTNSCSVHSLEESELKTHTDVVQWQC